MVARALAAVALLAAACQAVPSAKGKLTALPQVHQRHKLMLTRVLKYPTLGAVTALDAGDKHIYVCTPHSVVKIVRRTMAIADKFDLRTHNMQDATAVKIDEPHIFVTVTRSDKNHKLQMIKLDKHMKVVGEYDFAQEDNVPFGMEIDMDYIYTGQYTLPGRVLQINKKTMKLVARIVLKDGENDIRQLESDPTDPYDEFLYANTNTMPGQIIKIRKNGMKPVGRLTLSKSEAYPLAGIELDKDFLYVGTNTQPGHILKIDKHLMKRVDHVTLAKGDDNIASLESDAQYLFAACYTSPGRVVRISKKSLKRIEHLVLPSDAKQLTSLAHGMAHLYAGTFTNPGKIIEMFGYEQPVDCEVGDWGYWSVPTKDCGGTQSRTRAVIQPAYFGGKSCNGIPMVQSQNYTAPWCSLTGSCKGGKIFSKHASPCKRTCEEPNPVCITTYDKKLTTPGCVCPPDKPLEYNGICTTAGWCPQAHMEECSHLHCHYDGTRVRVHHNGQEQKGEKHYCRHSATLYGGCHCLCYHDQLQPPKAGGGAVWLAKATKAVKAGQALPAAVP